MFALQEDRFKAQVQDTSISQVVCLPLATYIEELLSHTNSPKYKGGYWFNSQRSCTSNKDLS